MMATGKTTESLHQKSHSPDLTFGRPSWLVLALRHDPDEDVTWRGLTDTGHAVRWFSSTGAQEHMSRRGRELSLLSDGIWTSQEHCSKLPPKLHWLSVVGLRWACGKTLLRVGTPQPIQALLRLVPSPTPQRVSRGLQRGLESSGVWPVVARFAEKVVLVSQPLSYSNQALHSLSLCPLSFSLFTTPPPHPLSLSLSLCLFWVALPLCCHCVHLGCRGLKLIPTLVSAEYRELENPFPHHHQHILTSTPTTTFTTLVEVIPPSIS